MNVSIKAVFRQQREIVLIMLLSLWNFILLLGTQTYADTVGFRVLILWFQLLLLISYALATEKYFPHCPACFYDVNSSRVFVVLMSLSLLETRNTPGKI